MSRLLQRLAQSNLNAGAPARPQRVANVHILLVVSIIFIIIIAFMRNPPSRLRPLHIFSDIPTLLYFPRNFSVS